MTEQQKEQISSLNKIIVDDNGYAFLTLNRDGNILKAEDEDYSLDLTKFKTVCRVRKNIFENICERIMKDTYPNHKFDYENAAAHKRKIVFSYMINEHEYLMECEISAKLTLQHLGLMKV